MSTINIRSITPKDNKTLARIIRAIFIEYDAPTEGTVYSDPTTDNLYRLFETPKAELFVAEQDGELLGCCGIYPTEGLPADCTEIVKFYISRKGRGKGFGKMLYAACEKRALELNYHQLYIESIPEFDTAVGLYKKLGFKSLPKPLGNSGHFGCNIWLIKTLQK